MEDLETLGGGDAHRAVDPPGTRSSHVEIARASARGSLILFTGSILSTGILAVSAVVIARLLGPSVYGEYTLALLIPGIVYNLVGFGVLTGVTRFAAFHVARGEITVARRMTLNGLLFLIPFGLVLSVVSYISAGYATSVILQRSSLTPLAQIGAWLVFAQTVEQAAIVSMQGWREMGMLSATNVIQALLKLGIATSLVVMGFEVFGALVGNVLSYVLSGVAIFPFLYRRVKLAEGFDLVEFFNDIRRMVSYGFSFYAGNLLIVFSTQFVTIVLAIIASDAVVGDYQYATLYVAAIHLATTAFTVAFFPAFAHLEGTDYDMGLAFRYAVHYSGLVLTPIVFFLIGAASALVISFGGQPYSSAAAYLALLSFSNLPQVAGAAMLQSFFSGVGKTRPFMIYTVAGSAAQIALAPILGVELGLGVTGLILSIFFTNLVATAFGLYLAWKGLNAVPDFRALFRTVISGLASFFPTFFLQNLALPEPIILVVQGVVFLTAYLTVAPLAGAIHEDDLVRLRISVEGLGKFSAFAGLILRYESFVLRLVQQIFKRPGTV